MQAGLADHSLKSKTARRGCCLHDDACLLLLVQLFLPQERWELDGQLSTLNSPLARSGVSEFLLCSIGSAFFFTVYLLPVKMARGKRQMSKKKRGAGIPWLLVLSLLYSTVTAAGSPPLASQQQLLLPPWAHDFHGYDPKSDLSRTDRKIWVVTTASLPWLTGTAVNPLLRAALLTRNRAPGSVTLMIPFLELEEDQRRVFPRNVTFSSHAEQCSAVKEWLENAGLSEEASRLRVVLYPARYHASYGSIFPMGDLGDLVPTGEADICVLEEPEHLCWYRAPGPAWTERFNYVVSIVHTNYLAYAQGYGVWGPFLATMLKFMNKLVVRANTDRVIKLSAAIQPLASEKEVVCNVHGVRSCFFVPPAAAISEGGSGQVPSQGAYFIGKSLWAKGYSGLLVLSTQARRKYGFSFPLHVYGSGPDRAEIECRFERSGLPCTFHDGLDHSKLYSKYSVFVNPSTSEVLCTTVAEALGMGKWVVCARHPSNEFFFQFPNCIPFDPSDPRDFAASVSYALHHRPSPLPEVLRRQLTWEAAIERLETCSLRTAGHFQQGRPRLDALCRFVHAMAGRGRLGDLVRWVAGAEVASSQVKFVRKRPHWTLDYCESGQK